LACVCTLSLHDALPIFRRWLTVPAAAVPAAALPPVSGWRRYRPPPELPVRLCCHYCGRHPAPDQAGPAAAEPGAAPGTDAGGCRSEEHTSELQSRENLV